MYNPSTSLPSNSACAGNVKNKEFHNPIPGSLRFLK